MTDVFDEIPHAREKLALGSYIMESGGTDEERRKVWKEFDRIKDADPRTVVTYSRRYQIVYADGVPQE